MSPVGVTPAVRWIAALAVLHHALVGALFGLGDAEALYAVYARHWQGGYLEHPPLVALAIRLSTALLGDSMFALRLPAALGFGATILLAERLARALGGSARAGVLAAVAIVCVPMFSAGSIAITPDVLAAPLVLATLLAAARAVDPGPPAGEARLGWGGPASAVRALPVGILLGLAFVAKYTAILVVPGLVIVALRRRLGVPALVAALAALVVASPVALWNHAHGWPGVLHRFVWSQGGAGLSLRNLGALVGGQLAYVGPPMLLLLGRTMLPTPASSARWGPRIPTPASSARWGPRGRGGGPDVVRLPALAALAGSAAICLVSRVAEPHWTATAWLPACVAAALHWDTTPRWLARAAVAWAAAVLVILHLYVLTPLAPRLLPSWAYDARTDIANELYGWPSVARAIVRRRRPGEAVAAGHYTMCAQLEVAIGDPGKSPKGESPVRCLTVEADDWDLWGRGALPGGEGLFVSDARYTAVPSGARFLEEVRIVRGGRVVRTFRLWRLVYDARRS